MQKITRSLGFFKATAIGGLIFLLPLVVVLVVLGYAYSFAVAAHDVLIPYLPIDSVAGFLLLFAAIVALIVLLCFFAGLAAARAIGQTFTSTVERQLTTVFPKYVVYKQLLAGNLGAESTRIILKPVLVTFHDHAKPAFETDRLADGRVVVYLPGSPDAWIGQVVIVSAEAVQPVDQTFPKFVEIFERMGDDSRDILWPSPTLTN
jgi:uncharacterized membrane protein